MKHEMILSASGWRKIFAEDGNEDSTTKNIGNTNKVLGYLIGTTFAEYLKAKLSKTNLQVAIAHDTRPTGVELTQFVAGGLNENSIATTYIGNASAPEIMAYGKKFDGFVYISASHNPIGHNGIKFGLSDGGVLEGKEARVLIDNFEEKCSKITDEECDEILREPFENPNPDFEKKQDALKCYTNFMKHIVTGTESEEEQKKIFEAIKKELEKNPWTVVADMNGSARTVSIDSSFFSDLGINLHAISNKPGQIVHEIIPEPENLVHCAREMESLQNNGAKFAILGYMPDCDGDRGNVVYWDEKNKEARPVPAQNVFALCVLSELAFEIWKDENAENLGVAVNCPTSMRIDEICEAFNASLFRAEVGEANVVNLAREKRAEGYNVRIYGEGSNGGNITFPSAVRDPIATVFALIKLLTIRDAEGKMGIFHLWCKKSNQEDKYKDNFTLTDVIDTLPKYVTTGVSEKRAVLKVKSEDKGLLKEKFRKVFEDQWTRKSADFESKYGITSYQAAVTNGTKETINPESWNNKNGGLKVKFLDSNNNSIAFIWMRPSGTEPVFRVMADAKGTNPKMEAELLEWETEMINLSDC